LPVRGGPLFGPAEVLPYCAPNGGVAQSVRAPACHAGGRGFEPRRSRPQRTATRRIGQHVSGHDGRAIDRSSPFWVPSPRCTRASDRLVGGATILGARNRFRADAAARIAFSSERQMLGAKGGEGQVPDETLARRRGCRISPRPRLIVVESSNRDATSRAALTSTWRHADGVRLASVIALEFSPTPLTYATASVPSRRLWHPVETLARRAKQGRGRMPFSGGRRRR
jgi:hypothetical protein